MVEMCCDACLASPRRLILESESVLVHGLAARLGDFFSLVVSDF